MAIDFSNVWPYSEMKTETVDGQEMVYIPKIYVCNTKLPDTSKYAGKYRFSIAPEKLDDNWHVHPAFMNKGEEMSGIQISAYTAGKDSSGKATSLKDGSRWTNMTRDSAHSLGLNRNVSGGKADQTGWHCYNVYEHHLIARLMLIEYGSSDLQTLLTGSDSGNNATWRGIHEVYGGNVSFWIDGIDTLGSGSAIRIFDNDGGQAYVDTGIKPCGSGWLKTTLHNVGKNYDMGDVFVAESVDGTQSNGSFGDYQYLNGGYVFFAYNGGSAYSGPFYLLDNSASGAVPASGSGWQDMSSDACRVSRDATRGSAEPSRKTLVMKINSFVRYTQIATTNSNYPRGQRFLMCQDTQRKAWELLDLAVRCMKGYMQKSTLHSMDILIEELRWRIRDSYDLEYISMHRYNVWSEQIDEIGRMVGGWIKKKSAQ